MKNLILFDRFDATQAKKEPSASLWQMSCGIDESINTKVLGCDMYQTSVAFYIQVHRNVLQILTTKFRLLSVICLKIMS